MGRSLSFTKRTELESFQPNPQEDPINLIERLDYLLWEYMELPAPEEWPGHRKIRLILKLLSNWEGLHTMVDAIRRETLLDGPDAPTYESVVAQVSAYWVSYGNIHSNVIRALPVKAIIATTAPPQTCRLALML